MPSGATFTYPLTTKFKCKAAVEPVRYVQSLAATRREGKLERDDDLYNLYPDTGLNNKLPLMKLI